MGTDPETTTVKIDMPDTLYRIYDTERNSFLAQGLRHYAKYRVRELKREIEHAESQLKYYKEKYGTDFEDFETRIVAKTEDPEVHEDYNTWFYWRELLSRHKDTISIETIFHTEEGNLGRCFCRDNRKYRAIRRRLCFGTSMVRPD